MKKIILLFALVIIVSFVFAGNIVTLDFTTNQTDYRVAFQEGEGIRFDFRGMDNKIIIREVRPLKKQVDITIFIESAEVPLYQTVSPKYKIDLDFDKDNVKDMEIRLYGFKKNDTGILLFEGLSSFEREDENNIVGSVLNFEILKGYFKTYLLYIILAALVLLLLVVERRTILKSYRRIKRGFRI
jgi:hypothetical protein